MILKMISFQRKLFMKTLPTGMRTISTSKILKKDFYEILGLTRNATQADIKNAYFELSKLYHPDRIAATDENLAKFREISDAYEILGNEQSRKLYDRGLLGHEKGIDEADEITDPIIKFYKKRQDLSKSLAKPTDDIEAWANTYFKDDQAKLHQRHMIHKITPVKKSESEVPFSEAFPTIVFFIVGFFFSLNFENTVPERMWRKIFH